MSTEIQWTDETWNPVTGCTKVSPGCAHCYAEGVAERFWAKQYPPVEIETGGPAGTETRSRQFTDVQTHADRLDQPLRWKKPRKVFVNSMSDLFHEDVPDSFIDQVFAVMARCPQHTFQVLTKRAERMRAYMSDPGSGWRWTRYMTDIGGKDLNTWGEEVTSRQLRNVWLGVSVENQHFADERIPLLLQTPSAVRFISAEPLLEKVNLDAVLGIGKRFSALTGCITEGNKFDIGRPYAPSLDWVIVGGESGAGARPFDIAWARYIAFHSLVAGVPVFVKQLGSNPIGWWGDGSQRRIGPLKNHKGGDIAEWPMDLRIREFPVTATQGVK